MRAEVLNQHFEALTSSSPGLAAPDVATTILNQEFLIALPPGLRSEVLEQEASYRARHESSTSAMGAGPAGTARAGPSGQDGVTGTSVGVAADLAADLAGGADNATFLAALSQDLREDILLSSDDAFIETLPPEMAAEARALRERELSRAVAAGGWQNDNAMLDSIYQDRMEGGATQPVPARGHSLPDDGPPPELETTWGYKNGGWYRVPPSKEHEPAAVCSTVAVPALVHLLRLNNSQYGKTLLFHMLANLCKNSSTHQRVLDLLFGTLTSSSAVPDTSVSINDGFSRYDGATTAVVIRRALELLTNLCKNDKPMAEAIIAVRLPESSGAVDSSLAPNEAPCRISILVRLLAEPLFKRSTVHQEQLLLLLTTVCNAIPPAHAPATSVQPESAPSRLDADMSGDSAQADLMDHDMRDSPDECGRQVLHETEESSRRDDKDDADNESTKSNDTKIEDVVVPVKYRVPSLRDEDIQALTDVLLQEGSSERTYQRATTVLGQFGMLPSNQVRALDALSMSATRLGNAVGSGFRDFVSSLPCGTTEVDNSARADTVRTFSMAASDDEITLLRVVKAISVLIQGVSDFNPVISSGVASEDERMQSNIVALVDCATMENNDSESDRLVDVRQFFVGLDPLWKSLGTVLDEVQQQSTHDGAKAAGPRALSPASRLEAAVQSRAQAAAAHVLAEGSAANETGRGLTTGKAHSLAPPLARLSPIIESFFVCQGACEARERAPAISAESTNSSSSLMQVQRSPSADVTSPSEGFGIESQSSSQEPPANVLSEKQLVSFIDRHRVSINAILRVSPQLLEGSFSPCVRHSHAIDFDNKKAFFRGIIRKRSSETQAGSIRITIRRDRVFDDSYHQLRAHTAQQMKGRLHVQFSGEEGVDAGGVTREWYVILARQIFDPNYALFCRSAAKAATYQPNKSSYINSEHLDNFRFVGRIFGKAIYDGQLLDAYFTRAFYKHILGVKPTYHDIEAQDPDYYKSLCWMLENDITDVLDETFSTVYEEFGQEKTIDLKHCGRNIPVTEANKAEYVRLVTDVKLSKAIEKQIEAFKEGFHELIPLEDCRIFNEVELELLASGLPDIDVADLKANVEYSGFTPGSPQVGWFWNAVSKMGQEDVARLVMFVTGTSKVPLEGFAALQGMNGPQKFQIHRASGDKGRLPSAHTCFNQLDLPEYETCEFLSERLLRAIRETEGFGFA
jgi:hypothetical protein